MARYTGRYSAQIVGMDELVIAFGRIAGPEAVSYVASASKEGAELVLAKAKRLVSKSSGDLERALCVRKARVKKGVERGKAGVAADMPLYVIGPRYTSLGNRKGFGVGYGHAVELGHAIRHEEQGPTLGHVEAKPYLRPAADTSKEEIVKKVSDAMAKAIDDYWRER